MISAQGKFSLTRQNLVDSVCQGQADYLLNRMNPVLILNCLEETLAALPAPVRASVTNGLIKAYVQALFDKASYNYTKRERVNLLRRIFICRKTR